MSKLSIGQHGIQVETHEKTNVMSPYQAMAFIVTAASIALILFGSEHWIKILGALVFVIFIVVWIVIYICHSIKKPDLLQSESYRIEIHKIEAGMLESRHGEIRADNADNTLPPDTTLCLTENLTEVQEVEE